MKRKRAFWGGVAGFLLVQALLSEVPARDPVLIWAAEHNLIEIAKKLIEQGAAVNQRDLLGNTPLHKAVRYPGMVKLLIEQGAEVNAKNLFGETPLHLAVPYKESVEILLDSGADKRIRNFTGRTPIDFCMDRGTSSYNQSVMELLLR